MVELRHVLTSDPHAQQPPVRDTAIEQHHRRSVIHPVQHLPRPDHPPGRRQPRQRPRHPPRSPSTSPHTPAPPTPASPPTDPAASPPPSPAALPPRPRPRRGGRREHPRPPRRHRPRRQHHDQSSRHPASRATPPRISYLPGFPRSALSLRARPGLPAPRNRPAHDPRSLVEPARHVSCTTSSHCRTLAWICGEFMTFPGWAPRWKPMSAACRLNVGRAGSGG